MLDVITDFWKPVKKPNTSAAPDLPRLQVGSTLTFGYVPQSQLSGRKLKVTAINTYTFGEEKMTSFVLAQDREEVCSLIVANADGESYLALSRRIPFAERMKMFDPAELEAIVEAEDATKLTTKDTDGTWKHWIVSAYKKEISGMKGSLTKGDYRNQPVPANALSQPFDYVLLTSESNEYAIEIERHGDGRLELFATIYRRVSDVTEAHHPQSAAENRLPLTKPLEVVKSENADAPTPKDSPSLLSNEAYDQPSLLATDEVAPAPQAVTATDKTNKTDKEAKPSAADAALFSPQSLTPPGTDLPATAPLNVPKDTGSQPLTFSPQPLSPATPQPKPGQPQPAPQPTESSSMSFNPTSTAPITNGNGHSSTTDKDVTAARASSQHQANNAENDAIECDLRVANKIIEEALRNEMRLSDVIRRVVALPVANPESVQIPMTLTEADFRLLAIRYNLPASERDSIKTRIIEELGDFSGKEAK